jgi:hypothetical protein
MTLLPPGTLAQNTQGQAVMVTNVTVGNPYVDPGVTAYDMLDGNITAQVRAGVKGAPCPMTTGCLRGDCSCFAPGGCTWQALEGVVAVSMDRILAIMS